MPNLRQTFLRAVTDKPSSAAASFCCIFREREKQRESKSDSERVEESVRERGREK